ncbi:addiction module protein [Salinisphaera sp. RV14]|uniref:addiction module protein n=1 Tax=Salinisphaera sp. RV14 TaxID=3454140 RepID=UPI003F829B4D
MTKSVEELEREVSQLETADKYRLIRNLLADADGDSDPDVDDAWLETVRRRHQQIRDGKVKTRPASDVMADAYARLRDGR